MWFTGYLLLATSTFCVALGLTPNQLPSTIHKLGLKPHPFIYDSDESDDTIITHQSSSTVTSGSSNIFSNGFNDVGYSKQSFSTQTSSTTSIQIEEDSNSLEDFIEDIEENAILSSTNMATSSLTQSMSDFDILSGRAMAEANLQENILLNNSEIISDMISSTVDEDITLSTVSDQLNVAEMEDIIEEITETTDTMTLTEIEDNLEEISLMNNGPILPMHNMPTLPGPLPGMIDVSPPNMMKPEIPGSITNLVTPSMSDMSYLPNHTPLTLPKPLHPYSRITPSIKMPPVKPHQRYRTGYIPSPTGMNLLPGPEGLPPSMGNHNSKPVLHLPDISPIPPYSMPNSLTKKPYLPPLSSSILPEKKPYTRYRFSSPPVISPNMRKPYGPYPRYSSPSMPTQLSKHSSMPPVGGYPRSPRQNPFLPPEMWKSQRSYLPTTSKILADSEYFTDAWPQMNGFKPKLPGQNNYFPPGMHKPDLNIPGMHKPGSNVPGMYKPNLNIPGMYKPGLNVPGMYKPGSNVPGMYKPNLNIPGMYKPGLNVPGMYKPDLNIPGMYKPGLNVPGMYKPDLNIPGMYTPGLNIPGINMSGMNIPPYMPKYPIDAFIDFDITSEYFLNTRNTDLLNNPYMKNLPSGYPYNKLDILDSNYRLKYPHGPQSMKYPYSMNTGPYPNSMNTGPYPFGNSKYPDITSRNSHSNLSSPFWPYFGDSQRMPYSKPPLTPSPDYSNLPSGMSTWPYSSFPKPKMPIPMNQPRNSLGGFDSPLLPHYPPGTTSGIYSNSLNPLKLSPGITPSSYPKPLYPPKLPPSGIIPGTYPKPLHPPKLPPSGIIPGNHPNPLYPPKLPPSGIIPGNYPQPLHLPKLPPSGIIPGNYPNPLHPPKLPLPGIIPGNYPKPLLPPNLPPSGLIPESYLPGGYPNPIHPPSSVYPLDISYLIDQYPEQYSYFDAIFAYSSPATLIAAKELSDAGKRVLLTSGGSYPPPESYSLYLRPQILSQPEYVKRGPINVPGAFSPKQFFYPTFLGGLSEIGLNSWDYGTQQKNQQWGNISPAWNWQNIAQLYDSVELVPGEIDAEGIIPINRSIPRSPTIDYITSALQELGLTDLGTEYSLRSQPGSMMLPVMAEAGPAGLQPVVFAEEVLEDMNNPENVFLSLNTRIDNINVMGDRALGMTIETPSGQKHLIKAQDIIIGGNPARITQLLYNSGIGDGMVLDQLGIPIQQNLPAVGKHWMVNPMFTGSFFTFPQGTLKELGTSDIEAREEFLQGQYGIQSGILLDQFKAFLSVQDGFEPNVAINFYAFTENMIERLNALMEGLFQFDEVTQMYIRDLLLTNDILFAMPQLMDTKSQGEVIINSPLDLNFPPTLDSGMYTNPQDMLVMQEALQYIESLGETPTFQMLGARYLQISVDACVAHRSFEAYTECMICNLSVPGLYSSGGAIMGTSPLNSVVNQNLQVHGMENLYIMNSAVIPNGASTESIAIDSLIGQYGANFILRNNNLYL